MMIIDLPSSPLGPFSADGSLRKPNNPSLAKELQKKNHIVTRAENNNFYSKSPMANGLITCLLAFTLTVHAN